MIANPAVRKWLYVIGPLVSTTLLILVTAGVIDEGMSASIANAVASLLYIATGGVAVSNLSPKPATISEDGLTQVIASAAEQAIRDTGDHLARVLNVPGLGTGIVNSIEPVRRDVDLAMQRVTETGAFAVEQARAELERRLSSRR